MYIWGHLSKAPLPPAPRDLPPNHCTRILAVFGLQPNIFAPNCLRRHTRIGTGDKRLTCRRVTLLLLLYYSRPRVE